MTFKEVQELIRLVSKSELSAFKMKQGDFEISLRTGKDAKNEIQPTSIAVPILAAPQVVPTVTTKASSESEGSASPSSSDSNKEGGKFIEIKSPMVGTFYRSAGPEKGPFVKIGDHVESGSTVCIIEAMKLFNEIESEVTGTIVKILVEDATPVEYDQVLFLIEP
ncbi:MAG: acetyl-CoA carboxylase biotin carboxyl carrier protein [Bacteroidota bacterium]|nr:acetyl-CoA carboxylase biotin carboxyl carrier protein [Bacteroidota bacterium]